MLGSDLFMKKVLVILVMTLMIAIEMTGCSRKNNNIISENQNQEDNKELSGFIKSNINCDALKNIVDFNNYQSLFITSNGELYQISIYDARLFSNGTSCKKIESNKRFVKFIKSGILDSQNDIYYFNSDSSKLELYNPSIGDTLMPNNIYGTVSKDKYKNIMYSRAAEFGSDNLSLYLYYDEAKKSIYGYSRDLSQIIDMPVYSLSENEYIEYVIDDVVKTNKAIYVYGEHILNKSECEKYIDVKCEKKYEFYALEDEKITSQLEYIKFAKFFNGYREYMIVDNDDNVYVFLK